MQDMENNNGIHYLRCGLLTRRNSTHPASHEVRCGNLEQTITYSPDAFKDVPNPTVTALQFLPEVAPSTPPMDLLPVHTAAYRY